MVPLIPNFAQPAGGSASAPTPDDGSILNALNAMMSANSPASSFMPQESGGGLNQTLMPAGWSGWNASDQPDGGDPGGAQNPPTGGGGALPRSDVGMSPELLHSLESLRDLARSAYGQSDQLRNQALQMAPPQNRGPQLGLGDLLRIGLPALLLSQIGPQQNRTAAASSFLQGAVNGKLQAAQRDFQNQQQQFQAQQQGLLGQSQLASDQGNRYTRQAADALAQDQKQKQFLIDAFQAEPGGGDDNGDEPKPAQGGTSDDDEARVGQLQDRFGVGLGRARNLLAHEKSMNSPIDPNVAGAWSVADNLQSMVRKNGVLGAVATAQSNPGGLSMAFDRIRGGLQTIAAQVSRLRQVRQALVAKMPELVAAGDPDDIKQSQGAIAQIDASTAGYRTQYDSLSASAQDLQKKLSAGVSSPAASAGPTLSNGQQSLTMPAGGVPVDSWGGIDGYDTFEKQTLGAAKRLTDMGYPSKQIYDIARNAIVQHRRGKLTGVVGAAVP